MEKCSTDEDELHELISDGRVDVSYYLKEPTAIKKVYESAKIVKRFDELMKKLDSLERDLLNGA